MLIESFLMTHTSAKSMVMPGAVSVWASLFVWDSHPEKQVLLISPLITAFSRIHGQALTLCCVTLCVAICLSLPPLVLLIKDSNINDFPGILCRMTNDGLTLCCSVLHKAVCLFLNVH